MSKFVQKIQNRVSHQAKSGWRWFDSKVHPFPSHMGPVFAKEYDFIKESQWWSYEKLRAYQEEKLHELIEHAYKNVPYYNRVFTERKLTPADIRTVKDLEKLPILTKSVIRENAQDLIAKDAKKDFWIESHTSGSTGEPLTFLLPPESHLREEAYALRAWTFGSYKLGDPVIVLRTYVPKPGQPLWYYDQRNNFYFMSAYHLRPEVMREYVNIINKSGAKVIRGYPSSLYIFARFLLEEGITLPNIETPITSSEVLLPHYRDTIAEAFKHPVLDWYGCNERVATISQCPENDGYHTNMEYGILEVVDDQGKQLSEGEGMVLGTSLENTVMPLIRYAPEDVATITKRKTCSCGRGLPIEITKVNGRSDEILAFGDAMIPPINFYTMFHGIAGITQFQLTQHSEKSLEVKLVTGENYSEESEKSVLSGLAQRVGKSVEIELKQVEEIPRDAKTGKVKCIVNHTKRK